MGEKYMDTSFVDKALIFAVNAHKNTERRGKAYPYVIHCMEAVTIVATFTNDPDMLAAAALHDVVEDTEYTREDIEREFGKRVADLVASESDLVVEGKSDSESWLERKQFAIDRLAKATYEEKVVAMGDKLSNMRAIYRDYLVIGEELWNRFHVNDPKLHEWHYRGLYAALNDLHDSDAYIEFGELLERTFGRSKEKWGKKF